MTTQPGCVSDIALIGFGLVMYLVGRVTEWVRDWMEQDAYYRSNVPPEE